MSHFRRMDCRLLPPSEEQREDDSSIETDSLDELTAIRQKLTQIILEIKEIKDSLRRMEQHDSFCIIS
jgi:hypothetical protein